MAEEEKKVTFLEDPVEYCKGLYNDFEKHNESQRNRIVENRKFYEGIDPQLEERKQNAKVVRSSIYVHELRPAIDSVVASLVDAVLEQNNPIRLMLAEGSEDDPDLVNQIEGKLNEELRKSGVLITKFQEAMQGGSLMPIVSCKLGWEEKEEWIYEKKPAVQRALEQVLYMLKIRSQPPTGIVRRWGVSKPGPYAEILDYDEFLYDPTVDNIGDSEALIHRKYVTIEQIEAEAESAEYDVRVIKQLKDEMAALEEMSAGHESITDEIAKDLENRKVGYRDGKILVCEHWIPSLDNEGREETRIFVLAALKYKLSQGKYGRRSPWDKFKFPFTTFCFNKQFNRMEGTPLVEVGKPLQRVYNDNINAYLDYLTYNVFPILKRSQGTTIDTKPVFGPGRVWDVTNPEGLEPLLMPSGDITTVLPFAEMMSGKIRQCINAPDISQGIPGAEQEKATKTLIRERGTSTRSRIPAKAAGDFLIALAQMFIYMHQIMGDEEWLVDVKIDVPSLTGAKSPQEEREEVIYLLEQAKENPVYQTPTGIHKLRNLTEELYLKFRKRNIDEILPTAKELEIVDELGKAVEEEAEIQEEQTENIAAPAGNIIPMGGQSEEAENAAV